ncbi:hypothetical protein LZ30DRAFT_800121 [Colletotrichum cereale]|nr:hypothetical protein LZ30DRAFT_800121 [Colletotrichum cereale]
MSLGRKRNMEDILMSRTIKFIIGQEEAEYTAHSSSLTVLSQSLQSIIDHGYPHEMEETVIWKDVEPSTFVNLMEHAYPGDYNIPELSKRPTWSRVARKVDRKTHIHPIVAVTTRGEKSTDEIEEPSSLYRWMLRVSGKRSRRQESSAQYKFCQQHFSLETAASQTAVNESSPASEAWLKDIRRQHRTGYKIVFETHANLYMIASKFGITELRGLCIHRIRLSLLHAPSTNEVAAAVLHTTRVVYDKTNLGDPLRSLLVKFCITDMEWMMREEGGGRIAPLLRSVPGFAADLLLEIPHDD